MSHGTHADDETPLDVIADDLEEIEQRSPLARTLITVAGTIVVVALLIGAYVVVSLMVRGTETATSTVDASELPQVALRATDADVTVVEGDGDAVEVTSRVTSGLLGTDYELRMRGSEIEIVSGCLALLDRGCGVSVEVAVPAGLPVEVTTESGDVTADALTERVLTVVTGSGDVSAQGLEVDELSATTSAGSVLASFSTAPFAIKVITDSGDVDLELARGEADYQVQVESSSGSVEQEVDSVDDAAGFVRVLTESGDVRLVR